MSKMSKLLYFLTPWSTMTFFLTRGTNDVDILTTLDTRLFYHILQQMPLPCSSLINEDIKHKFLNLGSSIKDKMV
jgi:hypothetical protein